MSKTKDEAFSAACRETEEAFNNLFEKQHMFSAGITFGRADDRREVRKMIEEMIAELVESGYIRERGIVYEKINTLHTKLEGS